MSVVRKPVILWLWWYDRWDLIKPLLPIMQEATNYFLFYRFKNQEQLRFDIPGERLFWTDYSSPYEILEKVVADKVVFMGIENMLTLALLSACRHKKTPTFYLSHGLTSSYESASSGEKAADLTVIDKRYNTNNQAYQIQRYHTVFFFGKALLRASILEQKFLFKFLFNSFRFKAIHERLYYSKSLYRLADTYLVFSKHLARLLVERDGVELNRILEIGPYTLDDFFKQLDCFNQIEQVEKKYVLMIDQPIGNISRKEQKEFWLKLASGWELLGYQLVVKLHPSNYTNENPIAHANIKWVRDEENIIKLVHWASACLGYFSTMLLPIIWFKPCGLFNPSSQPLVEEWEALGMIRALSYKDFTIEQLAACLHRREDADKMAYERQFLYRADSNGLARLQKILIEE